MNFWGDKYPISMTQVDEPVLVEFLTYVAVYTLEAHVGERCSTDTEVNKQYDEWKAYISRIFRNDIPPCLEEAIEKSRFRVLL